MRQPLRVLHVTSGLGTGGAELMLERLISKADPLRISNAVLSLGGPSDIGDRIAASGTPVWAAHLNAPARFPLGLQSLRRAVSAWKPDVIQGWMYHGNVAATILARMIRPRVPVVWSVRQSLYDVSKEKPATQAVIWAARALSSTPALTIYNSREAAESHSRLGFSRKGQTLIPNGFDCDRFVPSASTRA